MSKTKWISGFVAVLILMLAVPVVSGHGGRWSGIDPEIRFNGQTLNVVIEWPEDHTCDIDGEIDIKVEFDKKAHVIFIGESSGTFECEGSTEEITLKTMTVLKESKKKDSIRIRAKIKGKDQFPFRVLVYKDSELLIVCEGESHQKKEKRYSADCGDVKIKDRFVLGENVTLGNRVKIGYGAVIGNDVTIDDRSSLGDGVVVGDGTSIGTKAKIKHEVVIGFGVNIGNDVEIKDHAVICDGETIANKTRIAKGTTIGDC